MRRAGRGCGRAAAEFRGVQLNVSDPTAAAQWYCEHMGGTLVSPTPATAGDASAERDRVRVVRFGKTALEFHPTETKSPVPGSVGSGIDHLGFGYADLDREMKRFATTGVEIVSGVEQEGPIRYAFVRDRWGTLIELVEDREIHGFHHVHLATTDPKATLNWYTEIFGSRVTRYAGVLAGIRYGDVWVLVKTLKHPPASTRRPGIDRLSGRPTSNRWRSGCEPHGGTTPVRMLLSPETARAANRLIFTGPRRRGTGGPVPGQIARSAGREMLAAPREVSAGTPDIGKRAVGFRFPSGYDRSFAGVWSIKRL